MKTVSLGFACAVLVASVSAVTWSSNATAIAAPPAPVSGAPAGEETDPAIVFGSNGEEQPEKEKKEKGDPVRVSTGQVVVTETDLRVAGRGMDVEFKRTYRSGAERYTTPLGQRWCHNFDQKIVLSIAQFEEPPPGYEGPNDTFYFPPELPPDPAQDPREWQEWNAGDFAALNSVPGGAWWFSIDPEYLKVEAYLHDGSTNIDRFSFGLDPQRPIDWSCEPGVSLKMLGVEDSYDYVTPYGWVGWIPPKAFYVRDAEGTVRVFSLSEFGCEAQPWFVYRMASIQDRQGNKIYVDYEYKLKTSACGSGPWFHRFWRPSRVIDTLGREYQFHYGLSGWLDEIQDFSGRTVQFGHDVAGNLISVRSPIITGTSTGNDFPSGRTTQYDYDQVDAQYALRASNMLRIVRPNEVVLGASAPAQVEFVWRVPYNRVARQVWGGTNASGVVAGGVWDFIYEYTYPPLPPADYGWFQARGRTLTIDPNGNVELDYFDEKYFNRLTYKFTGRLDGSQLNPLAPPSIGSLLASLNPADPFGSGALDSSSPYYRAPLGSHDGMASSYATKRSFDSNSQLIEEVTSELTSRFYYDTAGDVLARSNAVKVEEVGSDQATRSVVYVREPLYNQVCALYGARGLDASFMPPNGGVNSPGRYSVTSVFDYQEGSLAAMSSSPARYAASQWRIDLGQPSLLSMLAGWGIVVNPINGIRRSNLGDVNGDGVTSQWFGNVLTTETAARSFADPTVPAAGFIRRRIEHTRVYNDNSQLIQRLAPEGQSFSIEYHSIADPDGDGVAAPQVLYPNGSPYVHDSTSGSQGGGFAWKHSAAAALGVIVERRYDVLGRLTLHVDGRGFSTAQEFNACDEMVQQVYPRGYLSQTIYDANGNPIQKRRTNKTPVFDSNGHPTGTEQSSSDIVVDFVYDILNQPLERIERMGSPMDDIRTQFRYDRGANRVLTLLPEWTPGSGNVAATVYDELGRVWTTSRGGVPAGFFANVAHSSLVSIAVPVAPASLATIESRYGQAVKTLEIDAEGNETRTYYDSLLRVERIEEPLGRTTHCLWDPDGNQIEKWIVGPDGHSGTAELRHVWSKHDELNRVYQEDQKLTAIATAVPAQDGPLTPGDGKVTARFLFDRSDRVTQHVDDNGHATLYTYDALDRPLTVTDAKANQRVYAYDKNSNPIQIDEFEFGATSPMRQTRRWRFHDELNRVTAEVEESGRATRYAFDSSGNTAFRSDANGPVTQTLASLDVYSEHASLPALAINAHGNTRILEYDSASRLVAERDQMRAGGLGSGAIVSVVSRHTDWDRNGRVISLKDPNSNPTTYVYDDLDRVEQLTYANGAAATVQDYTKDGLVRIYQDANGTVVTNSYDDLRRLVGRSIAPGIGVQGTTWELYGYDALGRMTVAQDDDSLVERSYDTLSRVLSETLDGRTTQTWVDGVGNNIKRVYPSGRTIDIAYDGLDLPAALTENGNPLSTYEFFGYGKISARAHANDVNWLVSYDITWEVDQTQSFDAAKALTLDDRLYTWDRSGSRTSRQNLLSGVDHTYQYDSLSRLVASSRSGAGSGAAAYTLDAAGNRFLVTGNWNPGSYALNGTDAPVHQYSDTPGESRSYDAVGNLILRSQSLMPGLAIAQARYDFANRMVEYTDYQVGVTTHRYRYDALGRRIEKAIDVNGVNDVTRYQYAGDRICEEWGANGLLKASYVHGYFVDEVLAMRRTFNGGVTYADFYYISDDQFNVLGITNASGALIESYEYGDYGEVLDGLTLQPLGVSAYGNPFFFTGREFDSETDLYWYRTRYYDPVIGRFNSRDSVGHWTDPYALGNGYTYCGNNPWSLLDPYGTDTLDFLEGLAVGAGEGAWDVVKGMVGSGWELLTNFKETVGGMVDAFKDLASQLLDGDLAGAFEALFPATAAVLKAIRTGCPELDSEEFGKLVGKALVELAPIVAGGAGAAKAIKNLLKSPNVVGKVKSFRSRLGQLGDEVGDAKSGTKRLVSECFAAGTLVATQFGGVPIEGIQLGDRVRDTGLEIASREVDCGGQDWFALEVECETPDGQLQQVRLLRPEAWFEADGVGLGSWISVQVSELGLGSFGVVTGLRRAYVSSGEGVLVTATMSTTGGRCLAIRLRGHPSPLLVTGEHPLWLDNMGFVSAARLSVGDRLVTAGGVVEIESISASAEPETVFNLEINGAHSYYVGEAGVLAHNQSPAKFSGGRSPTPITMDEAVDRAAKFVGDGGDMESTGSRNFQFRSTSVDADGNVTQRIGRFDVNPDSGHVRRDGPHLNEEIHVNGKPQSNPHTPIISGTVRPGDFPPPQ